MLLAKMWSGSPTVRLRYVAKFPADGVLLSVEFVARSILPFLGTGPWGHAIDPFVDSITTEHSIELKLLYSVDFHTLISSSLLLIFSDRFWA